ncbi:MAG: hypothetical protein J1E81_01180 [Eubacterium sp.]|nr:hypothetical protein [Eubacterium sp.]
MAETKEKKGFKPGLYAVVAGIIVAAILVVVTIFAFTTRYTAFAPDKVAQSYVDTIVQTGDGYNAYKMTLVSKNAKYGDFIRNAYMAPFVNEEAEQAKFVGTGSEEERNAIDTVYETMYAYYCELVNTYGLDNYDQVFTNYFTKLKEVRAEVYGDEFMNTDYMFGAFESNVATYGESLTGTQRVFASDDKTILKEESTGIYQTMFGEEADVEVDAPGKDGKKQTVVEKQLVYKLTTSVIEVKELNEEETAAYVAEYKERIANFAQSGEARATQYGLADEAKEKMINAFANLDCSDSINAVSLCTVEVKDQKGTVVATQQVYVVEIGNSWYVDDTNVDTSALYIAK